MSKFILGIALFTTALAASAAGPFGSPPKGSPLTDQSGAQLSSKDIAQLATVRKATDKYHDIAVAEADGYVPAGECVPNMGTHYVNLAQILDNVTETDPLKPEILLYDGKGELVGVEYSVMYQGDATQAWGAEQGTLCSGVSPIGVGVAEAPQLFGRPFDGPMQDHNPDFAALGFCHFDFHVWVWRANPLGITAHENPLVSCDTEQD